MRTPEPGVPTPFLKLQKQASPSIIISSQDRCRSGLSGTPGKRVLVKANRGFESLPVRTNVRTGFPTSQRGWTDGAGVGLRGPIARARKRTSPSPRRGSRKGFGERGNQSRPQLTLAKRGSIPPSLFPHLAPGHPPLAQVIYASGWIDTRAPRRLSPSAFLPLHLNLHLHLKPDNLKV